MCMCKQGVYAVRAVKCSSRPHTVSYSTAAHLGHVHIVSTAHPAIRARAPGVPRQRAPQYPSAHPPPSPSPEGS